LTVADSCPGGQLIDNSSFTPQNIDSYYRDLYSNFKLNVERSVPEVPQTSLKASWIFVMSNRFGISREDEEALRARDKACVYCRKAMKAYGETHNGKDRTDLATIEHLNFDGPFYVSDGLRKEDVVICCCPCNSSRGTRRLLDWFNTEYCVSRNIKEDTVAEPVRNYLCELPPEMAKFISTYKWAFAKTYAHTWPHEYIVQERVDGDLFLALARHIARRGYEGRFYDEKNVYLDHGEHTYWRIENIINRCPRSETFERREKEPIAGRE
jgi:hypothetical protein